MNQKESQHRQKILKEKLTSFETKTKKIDKNRDGTPVSPLSFLSVGIELFSGFLGGFFLIWIAGKLYPLPVFLKIGIGFLLGLVHNFFVLYKISKN